MDIGRNKEANTFTPCRQSLKLWDSLWQSVLFLMFFLMVLLYSNILIRKQLWFIFLWNEDYCFSCLSGYYSGALNTSACMYLLNGVRGPFTPSQWLELEQQALIYKYLTANEPIPAHLFIPIKKALESAGLFGFNAGPLRPTSCKPSISSPLLIHPMCNIHLLNLE